MLHRSDCNCTNFSPNSGLRVDIEKTEKALRQYMTALPYKSGFEGQITAVMIGVCEDVRQGEYELEVSCMFPSFEGFCRCRNLLVEKEGAS